MQKIVWFSFVMEAATIQAATEEKNSHMSVLWKEKSSSLQMLEKAVHEMPKYQKHGHDEIIYKDKGRQQQEQGEAQVANQHEKEHLFVASSFASSISSDSCLIDSVYKPHDEWWKAFQKAW